MDYRNKFGNETLHINTFSSEGKMCGWNTVKRIFWLPNISLAFEMFIYNINMSYGFLKGGINYVHAEDAC